MHSSYSLCPTIDESLQNDTYLMKELNITIFKVLLGGLMCLELLLTCICHLILGMLGRLFCLFFSLNYMSVVIFHLLQNGGSIESPSLISCLNIYA
jgi:hypothetical protein